MKLLALIACVFFIETALAGNDSMSFLGNSTLVINENLENSKLKSFIQNTGLGDSFSLQSKSGDIAIQCKTANGAASCTFKFKKSNEVDISDVSIFAYSNSQNTTTVRSLGLAQGEFENSKGERFAVWLDQFQIAVQASKH